MFQKFARRASGPACCFSSARRAPRELAVPAGPLALAVRQQTQRRLVPPVQLPLDSDCSGSRSSSSSSSSALPSGILGPRGFPVTPAPRGFARDHTRGGAIHISEERLHEFLQAEVAFFAGRESSALTLKQVIDASSPDHAATLAAQEMPIRFAQRILQIEGLPAWRSHPELVEVHGLYSTSFRDLRLVEPDIAGGNLAPFTDVIQSLKGRMRTVIPSLANSMRKLQNQEGLTEQQIGSWLDTFLLSRIGTEMLTAQYLACVDTTTKMPKGRRAGIVDFACDPANICERAAKHVKKLCRDHYNIDQDLEIIIEVGASGKGKVRFPYVPQYLFYVLVELLKNSARATVEATGGDLQKLKDRPVIVTVGADPSQVAIRVHDSAGGIPFSVADKVWSYMYSTAKESKGGGASFTKQGTPLAGFGVGLPLSRLYARYLGGSLHLLSLPGIGTRAYLYLKRLESEAREELPIAASSMNSLHFPLD